MDESDGYKAPSSGFEDKNSGNEKLTLGFDEGIDNYGMLSQSSESRNDSSIIDFVEEGVGSVVPSLHDHLIASLQVLVLLLC